MIEVVDLLGVYKDENGEVLAAEMCELTPDEALSPEALIALGAEVMTSADPRVHKPWIEETMSGIEEIQSAEATIEKMQEALAAVHAGLERAETVAVAAEAAKEKSEQLFKVVLGLIGLSVVLIVLSRRKSKA